MKQPQTKIHSEVEQSTHNPAHILPDVLPHNLPDVANHIHSRKMQEDSIEAKSTHLMCKTWPDKIGIDPINYKNVAEGIVSAFVSGKRFELVGGFTGLPYLEAQNGVLSKRRMPRVTIRFHTRANQVLKYGHHIHRKEFICSITDCLPYE